MFIILLITIILLILIILFIILKTLKIEKFDSLKNLPKIIWIFWDKGWSNPPKICTESVNSWIKYNPKWKIIKLDKKNIYNYLPKKYLDKLWNKNQIQTQSDLIRLNLLNYYGGVWVDSTTICKKPLDDWLSEVMIAGFFAFNLYPSPSGDKKRIFSSWFLAAKKNNYLIKTFCKEYNLYWENRISSNDYFNIYHVFYKLYKRDDKIKKIWEKVPKLNSHGKNSPRDFSKNNTKVPLLKMVGFHKN